MTPIDQDSRRPAPSVPDTQVLVIRQDTGGISTLTLNRPEALNAINPDTWCALRTHLEAIAIDENIRCVVLRGAGRSFCAGNDLKARRAGKTVPYPAYQRETIKLMESMPQPVIAVVHGHCYTGAIELIQGCDVIVAAESARFADTHGRWGMVPNWGQSARLPRRIGPGRAKLMIVGGVQLDGRQAYEFGLVDLLVPDKDLDAQVETIATAIATASWHTVRHTKRLINEGMRLSVGEALEFETRTHPGDAPDFSERINSFRAKAGAD